MLIVKIDFRVYGVRVIESDRRDEKAEGGKRRVIK